MVALGLATGGHVALCKRSMAWPRLSVPSAAASTVNLHPCLGSQQQRADIARGKGAAPRPASYCQRQVACHSTAQPTVAAQGPSSAAPEPAAKHPSGADLVLEDEASGATIFVFGVEHTAPQPHIGEWIIRNRPGAVVVETALGPEHGAMTGNVIRCGDEVVDAAAGFFLRMFCQVSAKLAEQDEATFFQSPLWQQVRTSYNGEQLAYIGAFATGVPLVYGDRPKDITYRRLFGLPTIAQLDQGFSWQANSTHRTTLKLPPQPCDTQLLPLTEQIMMTEREALVLKVAHDLCCDQLAQARIAAPPAAAAAPQGEQHPQQPHQGRSIALVLGSAHLPGVQQLWASGEWRELVGGARVQLQSSELMVAPQLPAPDSPDYGLRRGLMMALMRLSVTQEVINDLDTVLGPVPPEHATAVAAVGEVYGAWRMQLASLPRDLLQQLVQGLGCDFYQALQPMRDIRPMHGGPGYSEDMVTYVRALNYELD